MEGFPAAMIRSATSNYPAACLFGLRGGLLRYCHEIDQDLSAYPLRRKARLPRQGRSRFLGQRDSTFEFHRPIVEKLRCRVRNL
jgi:hypothetical protein